MATARVPDRVCLILKTAVVDGLHVRLPQQLDRKDYAAVKRTLDAIGAVWSRKHQAHVFTEDPTGLLEQISAGHGRPLSQVEVARTVESYFATPAALAARVVLDHTDIADLDRPLVLEPSAGDGNLVGAVLAANPAARVIAVEPNTTRAAKIPPGPGVTVIVGTFEEYAATTADRFDAVVMNPPFTLPGHPTAWIDHVRLAWGLLRPGGRLTAIVPDGYTFRQDKRHTALRALVDSVGGGHTALPDNAFIASGTGVRTVVLWMDKTTGHTEPEPTRRRGKHTPSPEERAERAAADRKLREQVDETLKDPRAVERLNVVLGTGHASPKLLSYSMRNQMMLLTQAEARGIPLTDVDSPSGWRSRGRKIKRGVAGLRIVAMKGTGKAKADDQRPAGTAKDAADREDSAGDESPRFAMVSVFAESQTEDMTSDSEGA